MKQGQFRSSARGRPSKVMKSAPTQAQRGRSSRPPQNAAQAQAAAVAAAAAAAATAIANSEQAIKAGSVEPGPSVFDDTRMTGPEDYSATDMDTELDAQNDDEHDGGVGQAQVEGDHDGLDHDHTTAAAMAAAAASLQPHVDLNAAANMLANGGELQDLSQGLAQAHHHPHAHSHHQPPQHQQQPPQQPHQQHQHQHPHQHQHQQLQPQPQAQMGGAEHGHQHPHHSVMDPALVKSTEEFARESGYTELNIESTLAKRLANEPGHRLAQQRRPEQQLNLARRSNVEALFAHIAGAPARVPCKNCHKGHGPWTSCIIVDGQMCGSCANCWFNASGARCSFHEARNPPPLAPQLSMMAQGAPGLTTDPTGAYRFTPQAPHHPLLQAQAATAQPGPSAAAAAAAAAVAAGGFIPHPAYFSGNDVVQGVISRATADTRQADKASRYLMNIEMAARKLALRIAEYEEYVNSEPPPTQVTGPGPGGPGAGGGGQVMGDEGGA